MGRQEEILDAAISIADEHGLDAVSMRSVAGSVGVTPMALYPHVGSKAALLDEMIGRLLGQLLPEPVGPEAPGLDGLGWRERLAQLARGARAMALRHPWAAGLVFTRSTLAPGSLRVVDLIYAALLDAGIPPAQVPRLERMVSSFFLGHAASEAGGRFGPPTQEQREQRWARATQTLPGHSRLAGSVEWPVDWDAEFEADLRDLVLMIEAVASR
jgi:AcrR family transcriptional regulator